MASSVRGFRGLYRVEGVRAWNLNLGESFGAFDDRFGSQCVRVQCLGLGGFLV